MVSLNFFFPLFFVFASNHLLLPSSPTLHSAVWYPGPSAQLVTVDDKQLTLWKVKGDSAKVAVCTPGI